MSQQFDLREWNQKRCERKAVRQQPLSYEECLNSFLDSDQLAFIALMIACAYAEDPLETAPLIQSLSEEEVRLVMQASGYVDDSVQSKNDGLALEIAGDWSAHFITRPAA